MKTKVTIYHNPRCSKSRETLQLLWARGIEPKIVEYLRTPPDRATLRKLLKQLGMKPRELLRTREQEYRKAGLHKTELTDEQILAAMEKYPILIERPIVVANGKAALGRPPESVLKVI